MDYGITVRVPVPFTEAGARERDALKTQGFGVLIEIDVQVALRDKLGEDMEPYLIISACNPPLAHHRPYPPTAGSGCCCRATWWCGPGPTGPSSRRWTPQAMVAVVGEASLQPVADEAAARLLAALDSLHDTARAH
jgi:hypothetical protein